MNFSIFCFQEMLTLRYKIYIIELDEKSNYRIVSKHIENERSNKYHAICYHAIHKCIQYKVADSNVTYDEHSKFKINFCLVGKTMKQDHDDHSFKC